MVGSGSQLFIIYHSTLPFGESQNISYQLLDIECQYKINEGSISLPNKATIDWIGFSTIGYPAYYSSNGLLCTLMNVYGYQWVPILDTNNSYYCKTAGNTHWMVSVTENSCLCAVLHGMSIYPKTLPIPILSTIQLKVPLVMENDESENDNNQQYIQNEISLKHVYFFYNILESIII